MYQIIHIVKYQVIIVGGGLAGLTAAIHLSKENIKVLLIEKNKYPQHKVCGEYISNEVLPYLKKLGFDPFDHGAKKITNLTISTATNRTISAELPLGGFGISRYCIDEALATKAKSYGAEIIHDTVTDIQYSNDEFVIKTNTNNYKSTLTIGAFGKRSNLDKKLSRAFINQSSPYLAVKAHYQGEFPADQVSLHNFRGGYCGLSKVENGLINVCYITDYKSFKKYKNIEEFQNKVISQNKFLNDAFRNFKITFDNPMTISQVSFASKKPIENHMLMCGDSAGMIHPLAGNGMSMAIRSGQMASQLILDYYNKKVENRHDLESAYQKAWKKEFQSRLNAGHIIARLFKINILSDIAIILLKLVPSLLPLIIKKTHGKPMTT